jgi:hypothetical protein
VLRRRVCPIVDYLAMSTRISIEEVVPVVERTMCSIDIRAASVLIGGAWRNVLTVVRASSSSPEDVDASVKHIWQKHGPIRTDEFRIDYQVLPFGSWAHVAGGLKEGKVHFADSEVEYGRSVDLGTALGYVQTHHNFLVPEMDWPTLEVSVQTPSTPDAADNPQYKIFTEQIQRSLSRMGYAGTLDAIAVLLGARVRQGTISGDVYMSIPVMAKITHASISLSENLVQVTGHCHPELRKGLRAFGLSAGHNEDPNLRVELTMGEGDATTFVASGHFSREDSKESLAARLVHKEIGEINSASWRVRDLLPEQYVNPLYFLLTKFCSDVQLQSLLAHPHSIAPAKTRPQNEFEWHVAWLLGCYGFSTIVLGSYEKLMAENTRIERGNLDLLAYHPVRNVVLFGGCTLNVPKEEDYVKLLSVRSMLLEDWRGDFPFSAEAVMFSGAQECPAKWHTSNGGDLMPFLTGDYVTVVDANRLADGVRFLQERNEEQFLRNLGLSRASL